MLKPENNIPQFRQNQSKNCRSNYWNERQSTDLIPTKRKFRLNNTFYLALTSCNYRLTRNPISTPHQLSLFTNSPPDIDNLPPYPLQIRSIPYRERESKNRCCRLVESVNGEAIEEAFTITEAQSILELTQCWDWERERSRCLQKLRLVLSVPQSDRSLQPRERHIQFLIETRQLTAICELLNLRPESILKILKRYQQQCRKPQANGGAA